MKMHALSGGRVRMRKSVYIPDADRSEMIELPVSSFLLRHPQGNVLFDTGCHPAVPDDPAARWGGLAKMMVPIMRPGENVLTGLAGIGCSADDIDVVVCSHLHPDHCGCNAFFKRASVIVHEREIAAARAPNAEPMGYLAPEWDFRDVRSTQAAQRDVFGDSRIVLIRCPVTRRARSARWSRWKKAAHSCSPPDTVSLRVTLDSISCRAIRQDPDALLKSLDEVRRIEAAAPLSCAATTQAQWETLRKGAEFYD
jgi:hypothetical protein